MTAVCALSDPTKRALTQCNPEHPCILCFWRRKISPTKEVSHHLQHHLHLTFCQIRIPTGTIRYILSTLKSKRDSKRQVQETTDYWETSGAMLRGLFQRKPKHERLEEEPEVRFKGLLVSERDLGYTYIRPGGKTVHTPDMQCIMLSGVLLLPLATSSICGKWAKVHTPIKCRSTSNLNAGPDNRVY